MQPLFNTLLSFHARGFVLIIMLIILGPTSYIASCHRKAPIRKSWSAIDDVSQILCQTCAHIDERVYCIQTERDFLTGTNNCSIAVREGELYG